jgi:hypothetical protein
MEYLPEVRERDGTWIVNHFRLLAGPKGALYTVMYWFLTHECGESEV